MFLRIGFLILCLAFGAPALADPVPEPIDQTKPDDFIKPTWTDLLHTMVRFNAFDLNDDDLLDSYLAVTDCDLYQYYYKDDFKWNQIRKSARQSAEMNETKYPVFYHFDTELQLDRYDFDNKMYRLTDKSTIRNVNLFRIYSVTGSPCGEMPSQYMPKNFQASSDTVLNLSGLPLAPADAQALLHQMQQDKNSDRIIHMRINMTVTYISRVHKEVLGAGTNGKRITYFQLKDVDPKMVRMDVHINSVNFYEDPQETKLIYSFNPTP